MNSHLLSNLSNETSGLLLPQTLFFLLYLSLEIDWTKKTSATAHCWDSFPSPTVLIVCFFFSGFVRIDIGGAYGTAKAGQGLMAMGIRSPELLMKNIIPVVMAGVLGIYGLIVAVILNGKFTIPEASGFATYSQYNGFAHLASGLCVGLCSLASGLVLLLMLEHVRWEHNRLWQHHGRKWVLPVIVVVK
jgi:ATP synthase proteolipid subunit